MRPPRPKVSSPAIVRAAADALLPAIAEWNGSPFDDEDADAVRGLLRGMVYSDAYDMAREFERAGWDANAALVDALDGWDFALHCAHQTAVREWVAAYAVRPRFMVGAVVNVPRETNMTGEIASVDEQRGEYTVRIDALGHVRNGIGTHGRIFAWEEVEAATTESLAGDPVPAVDRSRSTPNAPTQPSSLLAAPQEERR